MDVWAAIGELRDMVKTALNLRGDNTINVRPGPQGMSLHVNQPMQYQVRITANYGDGSYAWARVYQDDFALSDAVTVNPHGASLISGFTVAPADWGDLDGDLVDGCLAYERNRRPQVPVGAVVWIYPHFFPADSNQQWVFDYDPVKADNDLPWSLSTTLNGSITDTATSLTVADASKFPSQDKFVVLIDSEQICIGAPNTGTNTWASLIRGWNSTTPSAHSNGATVAFLQSPAPDIARLVASMVMEQYVGAEPLGINGSVSACTGNTVAPIEITTGSAHGLSTGDVVLIWGVMGNAAANGLFKVTVTSPTKFTLPSTGDGAYTTGGVWKRANTDPYSASILNQVAPIQNYAGPDGNKFYTGRRLEYKPNSGTIVDREPIYTIDLNNF